MNRTADASASLSCKTEREIAADMGKRQSTINYQKNKVFSILREALKDFI